MASSQMLPHAKTRKYDRQLRLWDSSGQEALESAHLCLLGSSAVASETAKNLVLPGLGELTIVDDELVKQSDIECNFFVPSDSEGLQRAAHVRTLLQDLNCDLKCTLDCRSASKVIFEENEDYWFSFTVVIACGVDTQSLLKLGNILYERNIPLIVEDVASFYGYMRISIKEHTIMETHPESLVDLRLDATWPALDDFTASYDLQTLTQSEREHVPYVVLLLIYLRKWRKLSGKSHPESSLERAELKKLINNGRICGDDQENYDEAVATIWRLAKRSEVPSYIIDMISSPSAQVTRQSSPFWILVAGLGKYLETHSLLPLSGVIPDMKADTKQYVSLQQIYRLKSQQDFEDFKRSYLWVLEKVGLPDNYISQDIAQLFCKHSAYLKVIYGTQLEYTRHLEMNYNDDLKHIYAAFRILMSFRNSNNEPNIDNIGEKVNCLQLGSDPLQPDTMNVLKEIRRRHLFVWFLRLLTRQRAGYQELHNIAAFMGGIVAQEAVKLISHQYIPAENTVLYDGIFSKTSCLNL